MCMTVCGYWPIQFHSESDEMEQSWIKQVRDSLCVIVCMSRIFMPFYRLCFVVFFPLKYFKLNQNRWIGRYLGCLMISLQVLPISFFCFYSLMISPYLQMKCVAVCLASVWRWSNNCTPYCMLVVYYLWSIITNFLSISFTQWPRCCFF